MKMPAFAYHRPASLDEAIALLSEFDGDCKVLAGGQSLLPVMALRLSSPSHIIDIGKIEGNDQIVETGGAIKIGCRVTHATLESSALVAAKVPVLAAAMPLVGHRAIRNRGTVCGSLAHADPAAELPAVARALGATFSARSASGSREIDAEDFFTGFLSTALKEDELLTAVQFPDFPPNAGASIKELSRRHGDFALVGVVAAIHVGPGSIIDDASLVYFGVGSKPIRVDKAELAIIGKPANDATFAIAAEVAAAELDPPTDNHASGAYRSHAAGVLTAQALAEAATQIRGAQ